MFTCKFFSILGHQNPGSGSGINESGSETLAGVKLITIKARKPGLLVLFYFHGQSLGSALQLRSSVYFSVADPYPADPHVFGPPGSGSF